MSLNNVNDVERMQQQQQKKLEFIEAITAGLKDRTRCYFAEDSDIFKQCENDMGNTHRPAKPDCVCLVLDEAEVQNCARTCLRFKKACVARGAGTGLEGGCVAYEGGCVCDLRHMKRIVDVDVMQRIAIVEAGVLKNELNAYLSAYGFVFGPDPSSNPTIGGMASTGGSGLSTLKYGTSKENVVALRVVTANGDIIDTRRPVRKNSTGYELNSLYLGAEGTLGIITRLTVKLFSKPRTRVGAVVQFLTVKEAAECVVEARNANLETLLRCEMLNKEGVQVSNVVFKTNMIEMPTLFLEFVDSKEPNDGGFARTNEDYNTFLRIAKRKNANMKTLKFAKNADELDEIWEARRGCYLGAMRYRGLQLGTHKKEKVYVGDVCVPIAKLSESITNAEKLFKEANFPCVMCCHIADGNYHCLIPFNDANEKELHELEDKLVNAAIAVGGVASGEHGVGVGKMKHIIREHGPAHIAIQRSIKRALDPHNIMNPNKIISWNASDLEKEMILLDHSSKL
jgi:D-lactate dehydrogenase (cytochrome)